MSEGLHSVTLEVDYYESHKLKTHRFQQGGIRGSILDKEKAIANVSAEMIHSLRLRDWEEIRFVSHSWHTDANVWKPSD